MATMRLVRNHVDRRAIGLWLAGVLCGVLLVVGITTIHPWNSATPSAIVVAPVGANPGVLGGRMGGISSSDTATDWQVRQALAAGNPTAQTSGTPELTVTGGRLGGIESADTANDAAAKQGTQHPIGPGEGP